MSKIPKCEDCGKVINPEEDLVYSSMLCNECAIKHIKLKKKVVLAGSCRIKTPLTDIAI